MPMCAEFVPCQCALKRAESGAPFSPQTKKSSIWVVMTPTAPARAWNTKSTQSKIGSLKSQARHGRGISFPQRIPIREYKRRRNASLSSYAGAPVDSIPGSAKVHNAIGAFRLQISATFISRAHSLTPLEDVMNGGPRDPRSQPSPPFNQGPGNLSPPNTVSIHDFPCRRPSRIRCSF